MAGRVERPSYQVVEDGAPQVSQEQSVLRDESVFVVKSSSQHVRMPGEHGVATEDTEDDSDPPLPIVLPLGTPWGRRVPLGIICTPILFLLPDDRYSRSKGFDTTPIYGSFVVRYFL